MAASRVSRRAHSPLASTANAATAIQNAANQRQMADDLGTRKVMGELCGNSHRCLTHCAESRTKSFCLIRYAAEKCIITDVYYREAQRLHANRRPFDTGTNVASVGDCIGRGPFAPGEVTWVPSLSLRARLA